MRQPCNDWQGMVVQLKNYHRHDNDNELHLGIKVLDMCSTSPVLPVWLVLSVTGRSDRNVVFSATVQCDQLMTFAAASDASPAAGHHLMTFSSE